ncbi:MAG: hypothetical protein ACREJ3_17125, partial [Polyangiaceae bacterium]
MALFFGLPALACGSSQQQAETQVLGRHAEARHDPQHFKDSCYVTAELSGNSINVSVVHMCRKWDKTDIFPDGAYVNDTPCEDDPLSSGRVYIAVPAFSIGSRCCDYTIKLDPKVDATGRETPNPFDPPPGAAASKKQLETRLDSNGKATIDLTTLEPSAALGATKRPFVSGTDAECSDPKLQSECTRVRVMSVGCDTSSHNGQRDLVDVSASPLYGQWQPVAERKRAAVEAEMASRQQQMESSAAEGARRRADCDNGNVYICLEIAKSLGRSAGMFAAFPYFKKACDLGSPAGCQVVQQQQQQ